MNPFEGKPWSVYVPAGSEWMVTAATDVELAVCSSPGVAGSLRTRHSTRRTAPGNARQGSNVRHVTNILPEWEPAESLLVVEVITPGGNILLPSFQARHGQLAERVPAGGGLLPSHQSSAGICLPAGLHGGPLTRRDADGRGWRRDAGAARLSPARPFMATTSTTST